MPAREGGREDVPECICVHFPVAVWIFEPTRLMGERRSHRALRARLAALSNLREGGREGGVSEDAGPPDSWASDDPIEL